MARRAGLRTGSAGHAKGRNRLARRHPGRLSADQSVAGAAGIFRRRTGIAALLRSAHANFARGNRDRHPAAGGRTGNSEKTEGRVPKSQLVISGEIRDAWTCHSRLRLGHAARLSAARNHFPALRTGTARRPRRRIRAASSRRRSVFHLVGGFSREQIAARDDAIELSEDETVGVPALAGPDALKRELQRAEPEIGAPIFTSLDAFRPLAERAPEPQIAEAQRREFFAQLHRWLRQGYAVHVFCNNDGERQRFEEIWKEYGFEVGRLESRSPQPDGDRRTFDSRLRTLDSSSARSPAASFATRRNWSSSPTRKFSGATKSSGRAGSNRRTRRPRVRRWTLISPNWRKAISSCICSTASGVISG